MRVRLSKGDADFRDAGGARIDIRHGAGQFLVGGQAFHKDFLRQHHAFAQLNQGAMRIHDERRSTLGKGSLIRTCSTNNDRNCKEDPLTPPLAGAGSRISRAHGPASYRGLLPARHEPVAGEGMGELQNEWPLEFNVVSWIWPLGAVATPEVHLCVSSREH